ncbi:Transposase (probable)Transposase OrfB [Salipiger mucosus DSM 16094]|uniref:Transposase (Probable)Transposase OrfB n=1 Tax=Salipiger mucosus DSM 16094 TaxID=1123237 RepID=S9RZM3_9RHOB|nr:Transposase (probable)Transposase OrfB [Salipiger mucosus DSM 16094]
MFEVPANACKIEAVEQLWVNWQKGLRAEALVARRDVMSGRGLREKLLAAEEAREPEIVASKARLGAAEQQMVRAQAVGTIKSWISNRENEIAEMIERRYTPKRWRGKARRRFEALPDDGRRALEDEFAELKADLRAINDQQMWMVSPDATILRKKGGQPVSAKAQWIARKMFLGLAARRSWPKFRNMAMRLDSRAGAGNRWLEPEQDGLFTWWINLKTPSGRVALPVRGWRRGKNKTGKGANREGALGKTINLVGNEDGTLRVALDRDMTEVFAASRDAYEPKIDVLGLDFGLRTLFATSEGDLLGQGYLGNIMPLVERADRIAAREQRNGRKPRDCAAYRDAITRIRGLIETEVNRALNLAVELHKPRVIAVERLDFRGSNLSKRMNRILSSCGRGVVREKLKDLTDRHGIEIHEVDPAYTSKTCSSCGYVDGRQRNGEKFHCRHCGKKIHADVNGARNIAAAAGSAEDAGGCSAQRGVKPCRHRRRPRVPLSVSRTRSATLREIVRRFDGQYPNLAAVSRPKRGKEGTRESACDPRETNPYFKQHSLREEYPMCAVST